MNFYKFKNILLILVFLFSVFCFLFSIFSPARAAVIDLWQNISDSCHPKCEEKMSKAECGKCTLTDVLQFGVNIGKVILQFLGVAALIAFIYGGLLWITSGGSPDKINQGKKVLTGALIGIMIVVFAYTIVYNIMKWLGVEEKTYYPQAEEQKGCLETWPECGAFPWTGNCQKDPQKDIIVALIQTKLNNFKCGNLEIDGCFGAGTRAAVKKFQTANSLDPTGIMDQSTYDKLFGIANNCQ